ncbi:hypothetical protein LX92_03022 [Maribacter polysiphoniae]|uniref:Uncharacterized protein n=1 Tax=Maribacter polysiphoniae TaxID=429344 RepID=A0A316DW08_9FLAO|nr:hypothetical protein LX92_03022 [Maribacter polysiphoniae]
MQAGKEIKVIREMNNGKKSIEQGYSLTVIRKLENSVREF